MFAHFLAAQDAIYPQVLEELRAGYKASHWMWFIFPQLKALGRSGTAKRFGIEDLEEAQAYATHPVLGLRLRECVAIVNALPGNDPQDVLGSIDALKFRSCLTLFGRATGEAVFSDGLTKFYGGQEDPATLSHLT
ncbi:MAG: DUF1810 domain-containing protein [Caulobacterales bacterium]